MFHSTDASFPANAMIAASPPGCVLRKSVTSITLLFTMIQQSVAVLCCATSSGEIPLAPPSSSLHFFFFFFLPPPPPPAPISPLILSFTQMSRKSGLWIMFHSTDASFPANAMIAASPPGCVLRKSVTSITLLFTMIQQSVAALCCATSSTVIPPPPPSSSSLLLSSPPCITTTVSASTNLPESSTSDVGIISGNMKFAAALPATRPNTTHSSRSLPAKPPPGPAATSPAA